MRWEYGAYVAWSNLATDNSALLLVLQYIAVLGYIRSGGGAGVDEDWCRFQGWGER